MKRAEKKRLKTFEKRFGYSFRSKELLHNALTHKSYVNENRLPTGSDNERLEFLGDAVLELAISELLMERFPDYNEGELSKLRASIVNERQLADLARDYQIGEFLLLGKGEEQTMGREKPSLLSDAYEAVLGAIYLDRGFKKAHAVIKRHYTRLFAENPTDSFYQDYKTELQERVQTLFKTMPQYRLAGEEGPSHRKVFEINLVIQEKVYGVGRGFSKKEAEQSAAQKALDLLKSQTG